MSSATSVPLSGFLNLSAVSWQTRASRPCLVPQPFVGSSLQSLPLAGIAYPSRGRLLPCSHPRACWSRDAQLLSRLVSSTPTLTRSGLIPPAAMGSLSAWPKPCFPVALETERRNLLCSARFTCFEALLLPRVRSHQFELPRTWRPILSWVSASLEPSPSTPRVLKPTRTARERARPQPEDLGARPRGHRCPPSQVKPSQHECTTRFRRWTPAPFEAGPHRPSAASLLPWPWEHRASSTLLTSGALKYVESGVSRGERLLF